MPADRITNSLRADLKKYKSLENSYAEVSVTSSLKKSRLGENEYTASAYNIVNLYLGTSFRFEGQHFNISLACTNLFNEIYADFLSRLRTFGANNIGRNIVLSVKIPFNLSYN